MLSCAYILSLSMIGNFPNTQSFGTFPLFPRIWEIFEIFLKTNIRFWQKFGQSEKLPKNTDIWETSQIPSHSQNSQNFPNPFETPQDGMSGGRHTTPFFRPHQKKNLKLKIILLPITPFFFRALLSNVFYYAI